MPKLIGISSIVVLLLVGADPAIAGSMADDLQPSDGVFSEPISLSYYLALRRALLAEHDYRRCQMLTVPSFDPEWVVYLTRDGSGPTHVVVKRFKTQLWLQMPHNLPNSSRRSGSSIDTSVSLPPVERVTAVLPQQTADLLERTWARMLARVKYPETTSVGVDGTTYYMLHWQRGLGVRSGKTWSPDARCSRHDSERTARIWTREGRPTYRHRRSYEYQCDGPAPSTEHSMSQLTPRFSGPVFAVLTPAAERER